MKTNVDRASKTQCTRNISSPTKLAEGLSLKKQNEACLKNSSYFPWKRQFLSKLFFARKDRFRLEHTRIYGSQNFYAKHVVIGKLVLFGRFVLLLRYGNIGVTVKLRPSLSVFSEISSCNYQDGSITESLQAENYLHFALRR